MILFAVLALGLVIYVIHANFLGSTFSQFGSIFHYSSSGLFITPSSTASSTLRTPTTSRAISSSPPVTHNSTSSAHNATTSQGAATATSTIPASQIPAGFTLAQLSPYFKKITISSAYAGYSSSYGQISLSSYGLSASSTVDVTGWQIKTNRGGAYIPQAIDLYDPSGLTAESDISLERGQYVYIYSSSGPFNLRINKCIGYIANSNKFTPALPENCPSVDQSVISKMGFTGACESYIYSFGSCQVPDLNKAPIPQNDYACRDYISNNFNYKACFDAHVGDANFLSNQWWIWMGSTPLDRYHDVVNLFDKSGLLVDEYKY